MDNFRRRTRDNQRQAIDSILNAPVRSQGAQPSQGRRPARFAGLGSATGRRVDDFRRREGFHANQSGGTGVASAPHAVPIKKEQAARKASLLHMTLPGGTA